MNGYLLDTSICVALFRGNTDVENKLNSVGRKKCYITDVVVAELKFGAYKSLRVAENLQQISDFIEEVKVVPFASTIDRKSTRLNSSHTDSSRMPSSA